MWILLLLVLISPDSWSNVRDLRALDAFCLVAYLVYLIRDNIWIKGLLRIFKGTTSLPGFNAFYFLVNHHSVLSTAWECFTTANDVYMTDMTSLTNIDWEEMRRARPFELRVGKGLDIRTGWEIIWARWTRKQCLKVKTFARGCGNLFLSCLPASSLAYVTITTESIFMTFYPGITYRIWRETIIFRSAPPGIYLCAASVSTYWTRACLRDDVELNSTWERTKLRALNATYCMLTGKELNITRSQGQSIDENALLGELCRLELLRARVVNEIFASIDVAAILCRIFATQDTTTRMLCSLMESMISDRPSHGDLLHPKVERVQVVIDIMQKVLDSQDTPEALKDSTHYVIVHLCKTRGILPRRLTLRGFNLKGPEYVTSGGSGEIWKGTYGNLTVCLKILKPSHQPNSDRVLNQLTKEAVLWNRLKHPNILPFYGVYSLEGSPHRPCLVSPWEENGNITNYIRNYPGIPRFPLITEITAGLGYLHEHKVVHGDLKAANILVSATGSICLADFGISSLINGRSPFSEEVDTSLPGTVGGTLPWMAPELLTGSEGDGESKPTFMSDIYSLASVMYEVLAGRIPFHDSRYEWDIMLKIIRKQKPTKPSFEGLELSEAIWAVMERCWAPIPEDRPPLFEITKALRSIAPTTLTTSRAASQPSQPDRFRPESDTIIMRSTAEPMSENLLIHEYIFTHVDRFLQQDIHEEACTATMEHHNDLIARDIDKFKAYGAASPPKS
ncbi:hypothetical protein D9756_010257 [Leucocoprinus leucothites]|uniref:Protein kinase domain-containing protein n=1 Tax=Leucocoprinus leucothites TaxID=201217 RepID=A0A8H5FSU0_9AGAR|nr:hypothetical protein D9756_010257 [Leucoagaricus leucothites]